MIKKFSLIISMGICAFFGFINATDIVVNKPNVFIENSYKAPIRCRINCFVGANDIVKIEFTINPTIRVSLWEKAREQLGSKLNYVRGLEIWDPKSMASVRNLDSYLREANSVNQTGGVGIINIASSRYGTFSIKVYKEKENYSPIYSV